MMALQTCRSCGDEFDPEAEIVSQSNDEDFLEAFALKLEAVRAGRLCPDCAFESAFYEHTMKDV